VARCNIIGEGTVLIKMLIDGEWREACIDNVLHVPEIKKNLFSIGTCTEKGFKVTFDNEWAKITRLSENIAIGVKQTNKVYRMLFRTSVIENNGEANVSTTSLRLWHERLGHVNSRTLKELTTEGLVDGVQVSQSKDLRDEEGEVWRFKARLCARGFQQRKGIDYTETFSPVVRYDSLQVLLALTTLEDMELVSFDV